MEAVLYVCILMASPTKNQYNCECHFMVMSPYLKRLFRHIWLDLFNIASNYAKEKYFARKYPYTLSNRSLLQVSIKNIISCCI